MSEEEKIPVEEVVAEDPAAESEGKEWIDELKVSGEELLETVKELVHEAGVRRILVKGKDGKTLIEVPLALGLSGVILLPPVWTVLALFSALLTDCTIAVVRAGEEPVTS